MEKTEAIEELNEIIRDYGSLEATLTPINALANHEYSLISSTPTIESSHSFTITGKTYIGGEEWIVEIWSRKSNSSSLSRLGSVSVGSRNFLSIELELPQQSLKELKYEFLHFAQYASTALKLYIRDIESSENGDFSLSQLTFRH